MDACTSLSCGLEKILKNRSFTLFLLFRATLNLISKANPSTFSLSEFPALFGLLSIIRRISKADQNVAALLDFSCSFMFLRERLVSQS